MSVPAQDSGARRTKRETMARMVDDARGRQVRLYELRRRPWRPLAANDSMDRATLVAIVRELHGRVPVNVRALGVLGRVVMCLIQALVAYSVMRLGGWVEQALAAVLGISAAWHAWIIVQIVRERHDPAIIESAASDAIAEIISKHGHCASCGQDIRGLPTAEDGCTVCPECGSAWRID